MARVPKEVRDAVDQRYQQTMTSIEHQKRWVKTGRENLAEAERELAETEKRAEELADWLHNNPGL